MPNKTLSFLVLLMIFIHGEFALAKVSSRMRKAKISVVVPAAILSWNPASQIDDFMSTFVQNFTLTNSGTAIANGLTFSVPVVDPSTYITGGGRFIISSVTTTCGASLAIGASCTVDIQFMNCNDTCTLGIPVVTNGTVTATSGTVSATLSPLTYNTGSGI